MLLNTADLTAKAYGRRKPRYRVIPETLGLALVLLANRNTAHDRGLWLTHPDIHRVLGDLAEAFAETLTGHPSPEGWRGGALASLRTLAGDSLHEVTEPWPWTQDDDLRPVDRFWIDDAERWYSGDGETQAVRRELLRRLTGQPRLDDAWQAMLTRWQAEPSRYPPRTYIPGVLASWSNSHERPADTEWLHSQLLGRDPRADLEARYREIVR
jgi:hypothetical protein